MTTLEADGIAQRAGIDRVIVLNTGKLVYLDEKVRDHDYGDILLEVWSDESKRVPGWVSKQLWADYIAYAIVPRCHVVLLPVEQLQAAWRRHDVEWTQRYRMARAQNKGYVTTSVCVPHDIVGMAIEEARHANWNVREPGEEG